MQEQEQERTSCETDYNALVTTQPDVKQLQPASIALRTTTNSNLNRAKTQQQFLSQEYLEQCSVAANQAADGQAERVSQVPW